MIDLRVLGDAALTRADGVEAHTVLAQPKRFALLVHLVLAAPRGFQRRDALLLRFWPESDEERARASLRTALHFLRRALGAEVIETRGADEVRVAPGAVACDALAFEEARAAGQLGEALALYRGPLLPAFAVSEAPGWDEWLDQERARLQRLAAGSAWTLAERAEGAGDLAGAAAWARRAVELAPDEEEPVRRLMELLGRVGDRAGALRTYELFARRLATELETEPSPQTREVAERLRAAGAEPVPSPTPARPVSAPPPSPAPQAAAPASPPPAAPPPAPSAPAHPTPPPRHARRWAAAALVAAVAAAAWLIVGARRNEPSVPPASAASEAIERVAVLPFVVHGYTRHDYLGDGMVELLSATLDGAGELRAVDPRAVLGRVTSADDVQPDQARRVAERLGARFYVIGGIVASAERLQVTASLYDRATGGEPVTVARAEGGAEDPFALVDALTARLVAGRLRGPGERIDRIAAQTTSSLPALKLYLQGREALRTGRFDSAVDLFGQAVAADSTFALAAYGLSVAGDVAGRGTSLDPMPLALRHLHRLPARERMLLEARAVAAGGHTADAIAHYRRVLAYYADDVEAWYQLGDLLFHQSAYGDAAGLAEARSAFERVLLAEPGHAGALQHAARVAAAAGDSAAVDSLTRRARADGSGDVALEMGALRALALGDTAARARLRPRLARAPDNRVWLSVWRAAVASGEYGRAAPLLATLTAPSRAPESRADGHVGLAILAMAAGRPAAARLELDAADALRPGITLPYRVAWAPFPFRTGRCAEQPALRAELRSAARVAATIPAAASWPAISPDTLRWRDYLGGLLAACEGRQAHALARDFATDSATAPQGAALRAAVAWADTLVPPMALADSAALLAGARQRLVAAELLRRQGRAGEALRLYGWLHGDADHHAAVYRVPAELRRAELLEGQGQREAAALAYRRVAFLWREAEPELRAVVTAALRRAASLEADD